MMLMAGFSNKIVRKEAAPWCLRRPQTSSADPSGAPRSLRNPYPFVFTRTHVLAVLCHLNSHFFFFFFSLSSVKKDTGQEDDSSLQAGPGTVVQTASL